MIVIIWQIVWCGNPAAMPHFGPVLPHNFQDNKSMDLTNLQRFCLFRKLSRPKLLILIKLLNTINLSILIEYWQSVTNGGLFSKGLNCGVCRRIPQQSPNTSNTVEPHYNEVLGTMKITLLYRFLIISGFKEKKYKELGPAK